MIDTINQQTIDATPAGTGGRLFTQDEVNRIVSDRLSRERERLADGSEYKARFEAVQKELEDMKAAQLHQKKEAAYRELLAKAGISEKRVPTVLRCSDIDALVLGEDGRAIGADKLVKDIKSEWSDFVETVEVRGAMTPNPPMFAMTSPDKIADAFKPKI